MRDSREELRELDEALGSFEDESSTAYFGVRLMRESLERRRHQVIAREAAGELDLALTRAEGHGTGAEVSLVAGVLSSLQESLASIAQVLAGRPTARGLIPVAIKESVQLRIAAAEPGSLSIRLVPAFVEQQEPLFDDEDRTLMDVSIDHLLRLIDTAEGSPSDLLGEIADVGPRASGHIQNLSHSLAEGHANLALSWRSATASRRAALDSRAASTLEAVLNEVEEQTREVVFTGRLVGGSLVRQTFEFELPSPESTVLAGRVADDVINDVERLFGQPCTAILEVREARLRSGETRETHLLKRLLD